MTIPLTRTANGYEAHGRFIVKRSVRMARRGGGTVADGWTTSDTLTGDRNDSYTLGGVRASIAATLETESYARSYADAAVGWRCDISRPGGRAELYLVLDPRTGVRTPHRIIFGGEDHPVIRGGMVRPGDPERSPIWVRQLLANLGLPEGLRQL